MNNDTILSVKNLSVRYQDFEAISNISFELKRGDIAIIIGPNGAGKTTLLKAILDLLPHEGEVRILGKKISEISREERARIGYVPQKVDIIKNFPVTVKELLELSIKKTYPKSKEQKMKIEQYLDLLHISHLANKAIGELSGGQQQRFLIARALILSPEILLLDEPIAGIDITGEQTFYEFITCMNKQYGITTLLVSHDVTVVEKIASKVICVNRTLICEGKPDEVLSEEKFEELYGREANVYKHKFCKEGEPCEFYKDRGDLK
jgi:ABC-type Mn2+/Zn2+ transport system ATPase subunit